VPNKIAPHGVNLDGPDVSARRVINLMAGAKDFDGAGFLDEVWVHESPEADLPSLDLDTEDLGSFWHGDLLLVRDTEWEFPDGFHFGGGLCF
jgi:hypothetical protein